MNLDDVRAAREAIGSDLHRTPLHSSATLGPRVFLKAELFQRTGSFKPRGVLNKLRSLSDEERARGVIAASAGNHAQALAYCARLEGLDALLVMWSTASPAKIAATRGYGAGIDLQAPGPETVFDRLRELQEETGRTLVHPFDDALVIAGIATALPDRRVVGVEPSTSNALSAGLAAGEPTPVTPLSIADGLNAPFAGELPIQIAMERDLEVVLVEEDEIEDGMRFLYERAKLACEPAGAAAVGALKAGKVTVQSGETVAAVVTGGNVSADTAAAILARP
jgi:threonine dehydratase